MVFMQARGQGVESFISQPGLVNTPLNGRKLDKNKLVARAVDISATVYGQKPEVASYCLQRPATDPTVSGMCVRKDGAMRACMGVCVSASALPSSG